MMKGYGTKPSVSLLRYHHNIYLDGIKKTDQISISIADLRGEIRNWGLSNEEQYSNIFITHLRVTIDFYICKKCVGMRVILKLILKLG
jgi:hypothetical protein